MNEHGQRTDIEAALRASSRTVKGLLKLFSAGEQPDKPRLIRKVRDLYRYHKISQWAFDLLMRLLLNFGNWCTSVGLGVHKGYRAFQISRDRFHEESRFRPPIQIPESQARKDLEGLLAAGQIRWEK